MFEEELELSPGELSKIEPKKIKKRRKKRRRVRRARRKRPEPRVKEEIAEKKKEEKKPEKKQMSLLELEQKFGRLNRITTKTGQAYVGTFSAKGENIEIQTVKGTVLVKQADLAGVKRCKPIGSLNKCETE